IRRLLSMADRRAQELGIPDTNEATNDLAYEEEDE
ncbi:MAG: DNA-binding protein WhiA, partial [Corynebacterium casei]